MLAAAAGVGCVNSSDVSFWDAHDICAKDPKSYKGLPAEQMAANALGQNVPPTDPQAAVVLSVERRDCLFRVNVTRGRSTGVFGPYETLLTGEINLTPGRGGFMIVGRRAQADRVIVNGREERPHEKVDSPMLSRNGEHVAYSAWDGQVRSIWVDGKEIVRGGPGEGAMEQLYGVLDDGRAAYLVKASDGRSKLIIGAWSSLPFDAIRSYAIWRGERFSAFLQRGAQWEVVLDGRAEPVKGEPYSGVFFSADGAHYAFTVYRGDLPQRAYEMVLDGVARPLPGQADTGLTMALFGSVPVLYSYPGRGTRSDGAATAGAPNDEVALVIIGAKTPDPSPTSDDFTRLRAGRSGQFVQIGASRGPQFDNIVTDSLRIDEQGHVHYRARRADGEYELIDNVIQRLPLVDGTAALLTPAPAKVAAPDVGDDRK